MRRDPIDCVVDRCLSITPTVDSHCTNEYLYIPAVIIVSRVVFVLPRRPQHAR